MTGESESTGDNNNASENERRASDPQSDGSHSDNRPSGDNVPSGDDRSSGDSRPSGDRDRGRWSGRDQRRDGDRRGRDPRGGPPGVDRQNLGALEVVVDQGLDKAMRVLKRKLIREGVFRELKSRRYFEKPCERRKRKSKESIKKRRKEEARQKKNMSMFM